MRIPGLLAVCLFVACDGGGSVPPAKVGSQEPQGQDGALVEENKLLAQREAHDIDAWIARQGLSMEGTGTGVRVKLVEDSAGMNAVPLQTASITFNVTLIDGTLCYASAPGEPEDFVIEKDNVESGLHEAIQRLGVGDSAIIVIPSHRAYGLAGDSKKIPMRSTVIYHLRLVGLR